MDAVYPAAASALERGRRRRRMGPRQRHRTMPVTFAEIKEVDEEKEESCGNSMGSVASASDERRRRPDLLEEGLGREFVEFRRRRARRNHLREPDEMPALVQASTRESDGHAKASTQECDVHVQASTQECDGYVQTKTRECVERANSEPS